MIISIRGTSGSGKSHIVHQILRGSGEPAKVMRDGRKRPVGYVLPNVNGGRRLFVVGHYEIPNGGVDTLNSLHDAYELAKMYATIGMHVLMEGKNMSDGPGRLLELRDRGYEVRAVFLGTNLETCVDSVRARGHTISESTIARVMLKCSRDYHRMLTAGVTCTMLERAAALDKVREWLS